MNSRASSDFWAAFNRLPRRVQELARKQYALWCINPNHPSLRFKQIRPELWSVRITRGYRALGLRDGDTVAWFWIGLHDEYERLIG